MLGMWRFVKSQPKMRCIGRFSQTSQGILKLSLSMRILPLYCPVTFMPPALPPSRRGPVYGRHKARCLSVRLAALTRQNGEQVSMWTAIGWPSTSNVFTRCVLVAWSTGAAAMEATLICTGRAAEGVAVRRRGGEMPWRRTARREPRAMRRRGERAMWISWNSACFQGEAYSGW